MPPHSKLNLGRVKILVMHPARSLFSFAGDSPSFKWGGSQEHRTDRSSMHECFLDVVPASTPSRAHVCDRRLTWAAVFALVLAVTGCKPSAPGTSTSTESGGGGERAARVSRPLTVAFMPKSKGNSYFIACRQGA